MEGERARKWSERDIQQGEKTDWSEREEIPKKRKTPGTWEDAHRKRKKT